MELALCGIGIALITDISFKFEIVSFCICCIVLHRMGVHKIENCWQPVGRQP